MLARESLTVLVAALELLTTGVGGVLTPFIALESVLRVGGTSPTFGISKTAEHSVHSAISPHSSTGTENTALQPGHEMSTSICGIFQTPDKL
jgi:hypothetical protein